MNVSELRAAITNFQGTQDGFEILRELAHLCNMVDLEDGHQARELVIRALDKRDKWGQSVAILESLVRQVGLYPYLDPERISGSDLIALEVHRPEGMPPGSQVVFHRVQAWIYRELMKGQNVILSAPTSFGKSLITDAVIASNKHSNCAVVVPTIALIDETRRRLSKFATSYKVISHPSQTTAERNLFVLTQERVLEFPELPTIDFFVIDEFYKLDPRGPDADRSYLLNQAFYRLWKQGGQFYFLGPNIESLNELPGDFDYRFIKTDFSTVAFDVTKLSGSREDSETLVELCRSLTDPTLIYCQSPARTRKVADWMLAAGIGEEKPQLAEAVEWLRRTFHEEWLVAKALARGIGIHHGRLPRSIAQFMVRSFNDGDLDFLVCTSTLIEGVNTKAKNVVIFDNRVARRQFDFFTFNNIRGRSGRMFEHFIGHVFLLHEPPHPELPDVDVPVLTQPESAPESVLVQLDPEDLTERSRERLEPLWAQSDLSLETIKDNSGISPLSQIAVARELRANASHYVEQMAWRRYPSYEQLKTACELIWNHLVDKSWRGRGARTAAQLAFKINQLSRVNGSVRSLIEAELQSTFSDDTPDETVDGVLEFLRNWANFGFPRFLMALNRIQEEVFSALGLPTGDYSAYAAQCERLFVPFPLVLLEEYGLPMQVGLRLRRWLVVPDGDFDAAVTALRTVEVDELPLSAFEKTMVRLAQESA